MYQLYVCALIYMPCMLTCLSICMQRELWQGHHWLNDPLYHDASVEILNQEIYPGECVTFRHYLLGDAIGKINMFFTKVRCLCYNTKS